MVIAAYCETFNRLRFFTRFAPVLNTSGGELIVLSNKLSVVRAAGRDGYRAFLIHGKASAKLSVLAGMDVYEVRKKLLSNESAEVNLGRVEAFLEDFSRRHPVDCFFIWNGSSLVARAVGHYAKSMGIKCLYFEIGNFPGKLFVDPEGVNIRSWFARHYREIDRKSLDLQSFDQWRLSYLETKAINHQVQQAKISVNFNWSYPMDLAGYYLYSAPYSESPDVFKRTVNFVRSKRLKYQYDDFNPQENRNFLFLPLQVSTDSQLMWNSEVDNYQALDIALELARKSGCELVVKPHPAEIDRLSVTRLASRRKGAYFKFVNSNTFQLLQNCCSVVTINSTVGIEAMLCGKPVTTLGHAMYTDFLIEDLVCYLQIYLLDIDFFANEPLSRAQVDLVMSYLEAPAKFKTA